MTDRILDALARLCLRRNKEILIAALVLAVMAVLGATRLSFDPDLLNLIPQQNKPLNKPFASLVSFYYKDHQWRFDVTVRKTATE